MKIFKIDKKYWLSCDNSWIAAFVCLHRSVLLGYAFGIRKWSDFLFFITMLKAIFVLFFGGR